MVDEQKNPFRTFGVPRFKPSTRSCPIYVGTNLLSLIYISGMSLEISFSQRTLDLQRLKARLGIPDEILLANREKVPGKGVPRDQKNTNNKRKLYNFSHNKLVYFFSF